METKKPKCVKMPRSTKELSKEQVAEILKKKKLCNSRALKIVEESCETHVDESWLLDNHINQSHLCDIIDERSLTFICGYPVCANELKNVPKQQFKISLSQKTVYDISERKKFCSNFCYKAANFLKSQMLTSPLWFRNSEIIPNFKLLRRGNDDTPADSTSNEQIECDDTVCKVDKTEVSHSATVPEVTRTHEKRAQESTSDKTIVDKVEQTIREWFNIQTLRYLMGDDEVKSIIKDNETVVKSLLDQTGSSKSSKFDELVKLCSFLNLEEDNKEHQMKPLPDYTALKADTANLKVKVRSYYSGKLERNDVEEPQEAISTNTEDDEVRDCPLVDSHAQNALRRRVLCDKLNRIIPDICLSMELQGLIEVNNITSLVRTFTLSAHNVALQPRESNLIAVIIVKLLSLKLPELKKRLTSDITKQRTTLLLLSYNLPITYLDNLVEWLTDSE